MGQIFAAKVQVSLMQLHPASLGQQVDPMKLLPRPFAASSAESLLERVKVLAIAQAKGELPNTSDIDAEVNDNLKALIESSIGDGVDASHEEEQWKVPRLSRLACA